MTRNERRRRARNRAARKRMLSRAAVGNLPTNHVSPDHRVRGPIAAAKRVAKNMRTMVDVTAEDGAGRAHTRTDVRCARTSVLPSAASLNGKRHPSGNTRTVTDTRGEAAHVVFRSGQVQATPRAKVRPGNRVKGTGIGKVDTWCERVPGTCSRPVPPSEDGGTCD